MGYWKDFQLFCRQHELDPHKDSSHDAYEADARGLPFRAIKISDDRHEVSWGEIEALTNSKSGTHYTRCPNCGWDKDQSNNSFKIQCTASGAKWDCIYCGISGTTGNPDGESDQIVLLPRQIDAEKRLRLALRLWDESQPIKTDCLAGVYLRARGLELPPDPDEVLRFHERCRFGEHGKVPCMVALLRNVKTNEPTGIHRTYIYSARDGKAERMALGELGGKSAVKLWPVGDGDALAVGEGIETVLAAVQLGEARPPAWAATVALNLSRLPAINGVKRLTILADNDAVSGTGERAGRELRRRWITAGRDVALRMPVKVKDFNDLLLGRSS
jgi:hypothetical protein